MVRLPPFLGATWESYKCIVKLVNICGVCMIENGAALITLTMVVVIGGLCGITMGV